MQKLIAGQLRIEEDALIQIGNGRGSMKSKVKINPIQKHPNLIKGNKQANIKPLKNADNLEEQHDKIDVKNTSFIDQFEYISVGGELLLEDNKDDSRKSHQHGGRNIKIPARKGKLDISGKPLPNNKELLPPIRQSHKGGKSKRGRRARR